MFAVQSGVYLGYLFSTGIGLLFGAALLAGLRRDDWRLIALGGALLGYLFLTRPYDAVLWGAAIGLYALVVSWKRMGAHRSRRRRRRARVRPVPRASRSLYNQHVTGSFTQFPFTAKDPLDTFGLGTRRLMRNTPVYVFTRRRRCAAIFRNFFYFPNFLVGAWLGVAVAFVGLWLRRRDRSTIALLAVMAVFPARLRVLLGHPAVELLRVPERAAVPDPALRARVRLHRHRDPPALVGAPRHARRRALRRARARDRALTSCHGSASNQEISRAQEPWRASGEALPPSTLAFVATQHFAMHLNPFSRNEPQLDNAGALYANDRPLGMLGLIAAYPDRTPLLQLTSKPALGDAFHHPHPSPPTIHIVPLEVLTGRELSITARVRAKSTTPIVVSIRVGDVVDTRVLTTAPTVGETYETVWHVGTPGARLHRSGDPAPRPTRPTSPCARR